ncbi:RNA-binding S4 domain-containing protein [Erysipelothrix sp. D19-032]
MNSSNQAIRLQKFIAQAGVASRRKAEELIAQGRVSLNGKKVTEMGIHVVPGDEVRVNGKLIGSKLKRFTIS